MTANSPPKIGGLLLAAGGSSRLGQPKQLLQFRGKSLIRRAAETLVTTVCSPIIVVLGASSDASRAELDGLELSIFENLDWQTGMSSSINRGLAKLLELEPQLDAVIITLCDQPFVSAEHIDALAADFRENRSPIVAAKYGGTIGVPALFSRDLFGELLDLKGDKGARQLIRKRPDDVRTVTIDVAASDIDTLSDYENLVSS